MSLLLVINGSGDNWGPDPWMQRFRERLPDHRIVFPPDSGAIRDSIRYAAVWKPQPGLLATFPKLEVIFNLGAGVDALMQDASLPKVPLVRVVNQDLTMRMTEYIVLHCLMHHRRQRMLDEAQRLGEWRAMINGRRRRCASAYSVLVRLAAMQPTCWGASVSRLRVGAASRSRLPASAAFMATTAWHLSSRAPTFWWRSFR